MKRIIFALCLLIAVTSCVSKKKYMVAENGRLAALSRERVLNRNLGQQKDEIAKLKQQITDLMSDTTRLGQAIRDYRKSLYSNLSEQEKLKNYANAENKELREIGITIKGDGTLELDENKLKAADISQVKKLFTGEDGFAKKVSNLSGQIGKYAKEKVTELEKSSAQASSNYNRYARYANNSQSYNSSYYNNSYYNSKA